MIKNIFNFLLWKKEEIFSFLDYVLFLVMIYICYLGLKHGPAIEQLIIELKGGVV